MEKRLALALLLLASSFLVGNGSSGRIVKGTVAFATVGRTNYAFDIFLLDLPSDSENPSLPITDGISVNYNGFLVDLEDAQVLLQALNPGKLNNFNLSAAGLLAYVSERDGAARIRFNLFFHQNNRDTTSSRRELYESRDGNDPGELLNKKVAMHDRPIVSNGKLIYVSTQEPRKQSRQSWTAVYSTDIISKKTIRLTPEQVTDYSPSVSPSGKLIMVASNQANGGWSGEIEDLYTDLYVFSAEDGSNRKLVTRHGGWPSWGADDSTVYFHRRAADGWWSIYKASFRSNLSAEGQISHEEERLTPPGVHAFTPAASRTGKWIAVATRRPDSAYRHVEIFDLASKTFHKVTEKLLPNAHHYNPFLSPDSGKLGYHRCRGKISTTLIPRLELIRSPVEELALVRVAGDFPVFSSDGQHIAFIPDLDVGGIYITALNGEGMVKVFDQPAFGLSWDKQRKGVLYTSFGSGFKSEETTVHIVSILNADELLSGEGSAVKWKQLTRNGTSNNAFPAASPDGKWIVFRSGRSGHKNLYIMDAVRGEEEDQGGSLRRLTEGNWTDTMPNWSPDGEWIAFSSDRHHPGGGSFALYLIHPDGGGLHRVLNSSSGGRVNHPFFSPDSKSMVFTTDYAGVSAEPVSVPAQFQPYGEIFVAKIDGSHLQRLTHNSYEDGTPSWGPAVLDPAKLASDGQESKCRFADARWLRPPPTTDSFLC